MFCAEEGTERDMGGGEEGEGGDLVQLYIRLNQIRSIAAVEMR